MYKRELARDSSFTPCTRKNGSINGKEEGFATWIYPDGLLYTGQRANGKADGFGEKAFSDGNEYEGQFDNGKKMATASRRTHRVKRTRESGSMANNMVTASIPTQTAASIADSGSPERR